MSGHSKQQAHVLKHCIPANTLARTSKVSKPMVPPFPCGHRVIASIEIAINKPQLTSLAPTKQPRQLRGDSNTKSPDGSGMRHTVADAYGQQSSTKGHLRMLGHFEFYISHSIVRTGESKATTIGATDWFGSTLHTGFDLRTTTMTHDKYTHENINAWDHLRRRNKIWVWEPAAKATIFAKRGVTHFMLCDVLIGIESAAFERTGN